MISSWKRPSVRVAYSIVAIAYLVCASVIVADRFHRDVAPTCDDPMVGFSAIVGLGPILNLSLPGTQSLVLVPAFSNCNGNYQSNEDAVLANGSIAGPTQPVGSLPRVLQCLQSQFTGMAWQCVEFGRRYLLMSLNTTFGSVVGAADIYALPNATRMSMVSNNCGEIAEHVFPFDGFANGQLPLLRASDLIIYPRQQGSEMPFGHVAAVLDVRRDADDPASTVSDATTLSTTLYALVGEQNWVNAPWRHTTYSRALRLTRSERGALGPAAGSPLWTR